MGSEASPEGWSKGRYSNLMSEVDARAGDRTDLPVLSVTKSRGPMLASERFGKVMHGRDLSKYRLAHRDHIVADPMLLWDGSIGIQRVVEVGLVSPDYRVYRPSDEAEPSFLAYLVRSPLVQAFYQGGARGTNVRRNRIARGDFLGIPVSIPPLPEQRKIAAILSSVDEAIEGTEAVINQLGVVKKAMMAELLTRGIPGRHTRFKKTEIGEVPEGWEVVSVADIGPSDRPTAQTGPFGAQLGAEDFADHGIPVLKIGNVQWGRLDLDDLDHVRPEKARELERFQVRPGDLLFARQGATTGRNALADERCSGWLINYHIIRVATDPGRCLPSYLMSCFNSDLVQKQVGREKGRGNRDGINTTNILSFRLPLPPLQEQRQMTEALARIECSRLANEALLGQLRGVKSALMSVLLTGEVRVKPDQEEAPT